MSGLVLALDAATAVGSVALVDGARVIASRTVVMRRDGTEPLARSIGDVLRERGVRVSDLDRIVCGAGPGSFTGLRIAASLAKGLAMGRGVPMFAVSSLELIVAGREPAPVAGRWLAVIDALRGECFTGAYEVDAAGHVVSLAADMLLARADAESLAARLEARLTGPGEVDGIAPHARGIAHLGDRIDAAGPVDLASWEPVYGRVAEAQARWERSHGRPLTGHGA